MLVAMGDVAALDTLLPSHPGMLVRGTGQDGDLLVAAAAKGELAAVRTLVRLACFQLCDLLPAFIILLHVSLRTARCEIVTLPAGRDTRCFSWSSGYP
jgi:hypothetical protein